MYKKLSLVLIFTAMFLGIPKSALAFGITPAEIFIENIKPGTHYEKEVFVTRPVSESKEDLKVVLETDLGDMDGWFKYIPGREFDFPTGKNTTAFKVIIDVPQDAVITNYIGQITAKGVSSKKESEGVTFTKAAVLGVRLAMSTKDTAALKVLNMTAPDVNSGDSVSVILNIKNEGNSAAAPDRVWLEVMDLFEKPLESLTDSTLEKVEPFATREVKAEFSSNLQKGQYRVDASVIFQGKEIARKKMVLNVNAKPAAVPGERGALGPQYASKNAIAANIGVTFLIVGMGVLAYMTAVITRKRKNTRIRVEKALNDLIEKNKAVTLLFIAAGVMMVATGVYYFLSGVNAGRNNENTTSFIETPAVTPTSAPVNEQAQKATTEAAKSVKGASSEATPTLVQFRVERSGLTGNYPIYSQPTFQSEIIYNAVDGETFSVIGTRDEWYNVSLANGISGWLHKTEVKSKN